MQARVQAVTPKQTSRVRSIDINAVYQRIAALDEPEHVKEALANIAKSILTAPELVADPVYRVEMLCKLCNILSDRDT